MKHYKYLFIREDLSPPQQIIQTAHAVDELNKMIGPSLHGTDNMVLFTAKSENHLFEISERLGLADIKHKTFFEPDIDQFTAIATEPIFGERRDFFRNFKLKTA